MVDAEATLQLAQSYSSAQIAKVLKCRSHAHSFGASVKLFLKRAHMTLCLCQWAAWWSLQQYEATPHAEQRNKGLSSLIQKEHAIGEVSVLNLANFRETQQAAASSVMIWLPAANALVEKTP